MSSTPCSTRELRSRQPRRGQALLLAVLIMIFAALLSASFIAVVSVNLNQSARQTDKNRSRVAARAGLDYVRGRLAFSDDGDRWRNELENVPPAPGDADYNFYYTPMDIAQGWARTTPHPTGTSGDLDQDGNYYDGSNPATIDPGDERIALATTRRLKRKLELVKSPDPRVTGGQIGDASTFLSQVESVGKISNPADPDFGKTGALKITVIGLSNEDPTAYTRSIAYFGGYQVAPVGREMRVVGNWDFKATSSAPNGQAIVAQANPTTGSDGTGATPNVAISNAKGDFSTLAVPFAVTISNPRVGTPARSAVVTTATNASLTLAAPLLAAVGAGDRVELAANFGAPTGIDYDNDPTTAPTAFGASTNDAPKFSLSDAVSTSTTNQVDGMRVNNGLVVSGDLVTSKLRDQNVAFSAGLAPGGILASGVIAFDTPPASPFVNAVTFARAGDMMPLGTLQASSPSGIFASGPPSYSLINDGWNGLQGKGNGDGTGLRNVHDFQPPAIDSKENVERYRAMTRTSNPYDDKNPMTAPLPRSASLYGDGEGIYIDNINDYERVGTARMGQSDFIKMLMSSSATPADFERTGTFVRPGDPAFATTSLEQQHLRGWVGGDEFRGRGVEIELTDDYDPSTAALQPGLIITKDSRSDNTATVTTNAFGPDPTKAWKDDFGTVQPGIFRKGFPWPTNGVVFAEGNVRIKGQIANAPRSLTVVSMNNIYIEDSLSAAATSTAARKILLLARMNVVMNPTRALGRPDAQTTVVNAATPVPVVVTNPPTSTTVLVNDATGFKIGDVVETSSVTATADTISSIGQVTSIATVINMAPAPPTYNVQYTVLAAPAGVVAANSVLRIHGERDPATFPNTTRFKVVGRPEDAIQRRFTLPTAAANLRLAFNANADRKAGLTVATKAPALALPTNAIPTSGTFLTNKRVLNAGATAFVQNANTVDQANKRVRTNYLLPTPGADEFPSTSVAGGFTSETLAQAETFSVLKIEMEAQTHPDVTPLLNAWDYDITPDTTYAPSPFYYLAGVGNRYNYGPVPALIPSGLTGWQVGMTDTDIARAPYAIPMATSIGLWLSNSTTRSTIASETYNTTAMDLDKTSAFGFNPDFLTPSPTTPREDVLTADQSFYQLAATPEKSTLDSRAFNTPSAPPLIQGENSFTLRPNTLAPTVPLGVALPDYRLLGVKLEDVAFAPPVSTNKIETINPGHNFVVNAFVYAQRGSWFIIPGPKFDRKVTGNEVQTYIDFNANGTADIGEYADADGSTTYTPGDFADLNRNGLVDENEKYAMARYSRYNYSINFLGAIAENQTALVNDAGTTTGAVASWMDRWATTSVETGSTTPVVKHSRIRYNFDPTVVLDGFEATDDGFRLPYSPEIFNVS